MRGLPDDRPDCAVCGVHLPSRYERRSARGRPRHYCDAKCRERARRARDLERQADAWDARGRADLGAQIRDRLTRERDSWRA